MSLEIRIEDEGTKTFESLGWLQRKCIYAGRKGSPDRWYLRKGQWVLVEYKRPDEEPNVQQAREHKRLRDKGQPVYVIDSIVGAIRLARMLTEEQDARAR